MQPKNNPDNYKFKVNLLNGLSNPARRALFGAGITELHHLCNFKLSEIKILHGMGPKGIRILSEALEKQNLTFKNE
ncbi:MAG: DNA-binding protein [Anaerolineaceae bacterium]|jgi:hypothetical protein|nr:DNA-binding protein [Anaerolineaceae bacterium]